VTLPQQILSLGFLTPAQINMLFQILLVWHMQNLVSVMINCMLVMVGDLTYLIQPIISYVPLNEFLHCLISCMFQRLKKKTLICSTIPPWKVFFFNFTLLFPMLRIS
jgi:hypothetical protein